MTHRIQVISDIHAEFLDVLPYIKPVSDLLILAGDIGKIKSPNKSINFKQLIDYFSENWKHVVYVPGNHEYYCKHNISSLKSMYTEFFGNYKNVTWLDDDLLETDEFVIIGSTLWSNTNITYGLNDFSLIKHNNRPLTKKIFLDMHKQSVNFLRDTLTSTSTSMTNNTKPCIVVTHFPPSRQKSSDPKFLNSRNAKYFANDLTEMGLEELTQKHVDLWISGHTHYSYDYIDNGTRFVSNQIGYPGELSDINYNKTFEVKVKNMRKVVEQNVRH